jgi:hypothetical protein
MSSFPPLRFEFVYGTKREGRQCAMLLAEYRYQGIVVPAGFVTDFASTPWFVDGLFPSFDDYAPAAIPHDWLYATQGLFGFYTRKECDDLFLDFMKELGVPWWKRSIMYRAVRLGGSPGWGS